MSNNETDVISIILSNRLTKDRILDGVLEKPSELKYSSHPSIFAKTGIFLSFLNLQLKTPLEYISRPVVWGIAMLLHFKKFKKE